MGNEQKKGAPAVKMSTPAEIKTYLMVAQGRLNLNRNKKVDSIKKKKLEIVKCLKENNLDVAKAKMDSLIREEDYITVYDIIVPLLEILKERVTYIIANNECPPDLRAQLDSIIYASTRLEVEELVIIRDLIMRRYGAAYIEKADNNADRLVNINLVEKLKIKPASDAFLTIRLKQLCKEKKINYEFPSEIISDIPDPINNPFGPPSNNMGGGDINPYASVQGNNPYGQPPNNFNNNNPYGPPPGDNNPYGPPPGNNNPFGPPGDNNPYPPPGNNNPYGPPPDNNPFGPQQGNNNNPFGSQQGPPPGNNSNPFASQQGPPPGNNNNPYASQQGPPPGNNNNPYASQQGPPPGNNNNPYASQQGPPPGNNNNPYASQQGGNPFNADPLGGNTVLQTQNPNMSLNNASPNEPPKSNNPYFSNMNNNNNTSNDSNPFGGDNNNPFSNNMSSNNPYANNNNPSDKKDDGFPKIDNDDSNPYA